MAFNTVDKLQFLSFICIKVVVELKRGDESTKCSGVQDLGLNLEEHNRKSCERHAQI